MKLPSIFKGLSLLVLLNFLIKPVWILLIDRQVQVIVGHEAYGSYFAVLNLSIILSFIADAGLTNMVNQQLAAGQSFSLRQLILYKLLFAFIYILVTLSIALVTGLKTWYLLSLVLGIQVATSFFLLIRSIISAQQLFVTDAWLSVIDKFLMILIMGSLIYLPLNQGKSIYTFLYVQLFCTVFSVMTGFLILLRKKMIPAAPDRPLLYMIRKMAPFSILVLFMSIHFRLDAFLLERIHSNGAFEAGLYASAFRLLDATNIAGYLAASFLVPFIAKNSMNKPLIKGTILSIRNLLLTAGALLIPLVWVFADLLDKLLYHTTDIHAVTIMRLCFLMLPGLFLAHVYGSLLTAIAHLKTYIRIVLFCLAINIALNLLLIPKYGAAGCCMAAAASQNLCGIALYFIASKRFGVSLSLRPVSLLIITSLLLLLLFRIGRTEVWDDWALIFTGILLTLLLMLGQIVYFRKHYFKLN